MHIIKKSERVHVEEYGLLFSNNDAPGGYSFPCDKYGFPLIEKMPLEAQENYRKCLSGEHDVTPEGVQDYSHSYTEYAVGKCECGTKVELYGFTNTCDTCGREYNMFGQLLALRSQWERDY